MTNEDQAAFAAAMDLMNYALADGKPSALTPDAQHDRTQKAFWVEEVRMLERSGMAEPISDFVDLTYNTLHMYFLNNITYNIH